MTNLRSRDPPATIRSIPGYRTQPNRKMSFPTTRAPPTACPGASCPKTIGLPEQNCRRTNRMGSDLSLFSNWAKTAAASDRTRFRRFHRFPRRRIIGLAKSRASPPQADHYRRMRRRRQIPKQSLPASLGATHPLGLDVHGDRGHRPGSAWRCLPPCRRLHPCRRLGHRATHRTIRRPRCRSARELRRQNRAISFRFRFRFRFPFRLGTRTHRCRLRKRHRHRLVRLDCPRSFPPPWHCPSLGPIRRQQQFLRRLRFRFRFRFRLLCLCVFLCLCRRCLRGGHRL